jgi:MFS superfamily sulfate permease-like transporter
MKLLADVTRIGQAVRVGISDEESWFRNRYLPTGHATGWRHVFVTVFVIVLLLGLVAGVIIGLFASLTGTH